MTPGNRWRTRDGRVLTLVRRGICGGWWVSEAGIEGNTHYSTAEWRALGCVRA